MHACSLKPLKTVGVYIFLSAKNIHVCVFFRFLPTHIGFFWVGGLLARTAEPPSEMSRN